MAIQAQVYQENHGFPWLETTINNEILSGYCPYLNTCSGIKQKQLEQQQLIMQQQGQLQLQMSRTSASLAAQNKMLHRQILSAQISQQDKEFDEMIQFQNQRLRMALQEQRMQQTAALMKKIESRAQFVLNQKDQEIARAAQRTAELQELLQRIEMEGQAWQRMAIENEATVVSLNNTLEELTRDPACSSSAAAVAESCCDENTGYRGGEAGQLESGENGEFGAIGAANPCRSCYSRGSCMLFWPCRHLSSCKACEASLGCCPVCKTAKKASVEVLIF